MRQICAHVDGLPMPLAVTLEAMMQCSTSSRLWFSSLSPVTRLKPGRCRPPMEPLMPVHNANPSVDDHALRKSNRWRSSKRMS